MPTSPLGRWSTRLLGLAVLGSAIFGAFVASGQRGGDTFFSNLWLALPMTTAAFAAVAAGVTAAAAWWKHDRTFLVAIAMVVGAFATMFAAGELLFPH